MSLTARSKEFIRLAVSQVDELFDVSSTSNLSTWLLSYLSGDLSDLSAAQLHYVRTVWSELSLLGVSESDARINKDLFMPVWLKKEEGSFFTPPQWVRKTHQMLVDKLGLEQLQNYHIWDCACGSGSLLEGFPSARHLWLSTLNAEDVAVVSERYRDSSIPATAFQFDFLQAVDTPFSSQLVSSLPPDLRDVILTNQPLAVIINPPYSVAGTDTPVGRYLQSLGLTPTSTDLYRQFIWQVLNLKHIYNLTNLEFVVMVQGSLHHAKSSQLILSELCDTLDFNGGFLYPATDFQGIDGVPWPITTTYWSSVSDLVPGRRELTLDVCHTGADGRPVTTHSVTWPVVWSSNLPRHLLDMVVPTHPTAFPLVSGLGDRPLGGSVTSPVDRPLGFLSLGSTFGRAGMQSGVGSMPLTSSCLPLTERNFLSAVSNFLYPLRGLSWSEGSYNRYRPILEDDFYREQFLPNAVMLFFLVRRNFASTSAGIDTEVGRLSWVNRLFPLATDGLTLASHVVSEHYSNDDNAFVLSVIEEFYPRAHPTVQTAFDWLVSTYRYFLEHGVSQSDPSLNRVDANLSQLRHRSDWTDEWEQSYKDVLLPAWDVVQSLVHGLSFID